MELLPEVVLSVIVLDVVRLAVVAAVVVPRIKLPPVVPALPSTIEEVLELPRERKSVAMIAPPSMVTGPTTVDATPRMVRDPASDFCSSLPASVPAMMLPCRTVLPVPLRRRMRGRLAVLPSGMVRLPVKVRLPPALFVSV